MNYPYYSTLYVCVYSVVQLAKYLHSAWHPEVRIPLLNIAEVPQYCNIEAYI